MLAIRRSALRILSSSPSAFVYKPRTITSLSQSYLKAQPAASLSGFQRRWASGEAAAEEEAPISRLQPTPQEEVENAIHEDEAKPQETPVEASGTDAVVQEIVEDAPASETAAVDADVEATPIPSEPPAPASQAESQGGWSPGPRGQRLDESPADKMKRIAEPKRTVYIGNLFFDVTEDDLKKELIRFGPIEQLRLLRDGRGLSKGFGYVDFETIEAATAAINALHQQVYEGRRLVVQYAAYTTQSAREARASRMNSDDSPRNPPSKTLFIGNMSYEMTDRDLNNLFRGIRNVVDVRVAIDRRTGQPRGFAHADFIDVKSAQEALKTLSTKETYGRKLRLDYSFGNSSAARNEQQPPPTS